MLEVLENIKKIDYKNRLKLLENENIVDTLFLLDEKQNPWDFNKVLELYDAKDLLPLLSKSRIDKIIYMYKDMAFLFLEFLKTNNQEAFEHSLKINDDLKDFLLLNGQNMVYNLNFSLDTIIDLINYSEKNSFSYNKTCLFYIMSSSLKKIEDQEKFLNSNIKDSYKIHIFKLLDVDLVTNYIRTHIVNFTNNDLYDILMYSRVELNPNLYETKEFFKEVLVGKTIYETRVNIEKLGNVIDNSYFENLMVKEEEKLLKSYNKKTKKIEYNDLLFNKNLMEKYGQTKEILLDIVIDYLLEDSSHNVYLNVVELVEFCLKNDKLFAKEKLDFYKELLSIYKSNEENIIDFFYQYKDNFKASDFYDDMNIVKNRSYSMIKKSCLEINDIKNLKNQELSNRYGVDIYDLEGEPFRMLISCRRHIPEDTTVSSRNCYTLIGNENMQVIYDDTYIFGFNDYDTKNILHVYEDDAYSNDYKSLNTTSYINRVRTPDEIIKNRYRSEIQIVNKQIKKDMYESLPPSYVVCFDIVNEKDIAAAKKLNVPIIVIDRKKYKRVEYDEDLPNYEEEYTLLSYMESSALEKREKRGI